MVAVHDFENFDMAIFLSLQTDLNTYFAYIYI